MPLTIAAMLIVAWRMGLGGWPIIAFLVISFCWQAIRADVASQLDIGFEASGSTDARLMLGVGICTIAAPILFSATGFPWIATYTAPVAVPLVGVLVGFGGVGLFLSAHRALGRYWSPTTKLRHQHRLVRHGVFRHVRHPMYAAFFLISAAQALLLPNWIVGPAGLLSVLALYRHRLPREEAMMLREFGPEWLDYAARTPRLVPRIRRRRA